MSEFMENVQDASVLVLMSTYNGDKYLQEQLDSIFSQENVNVDILIRDDGSTDSTISLIQNAMLLHPDRVFLMQGSNLGYARSFTKLLEIAEKEYPQYDNYNAINVNKTQDIPCDYSGLMGVPITFLDKYCPAQFEIIWQASGNTRASTPNEILEEIGYKAHPEDRGGCGVVNGKRLYSRILIRNKHPKIL